MAKGDYITISTTQPTGEKFNTSVTVTANQNGRRVELTEESRSGVKFFIAKEVTRGGTTVKEVWVPASHLVAIEVVKKETE